MEKVSESDRKAFDMLDAHLTADTRPSRFIAGSAFAPSLESPAFSALSRLKGTLQPPAHHPEGDAWSHTLLVVDEAAAVKEWSTSPRAFMWAALLHDIGKPGTTQIRRGKITSYGHDVLGARMAREFLSRFSMEKEPAEKIRALVRWHMQPLFVIKGLPFADIGQMKKETPVLDVALLSLCDRLGRLGADRAAEEDTIRRFLFCCGETPQRLPDNIFRSG
ncbi:HD domain-containing protein [Papillibacter cinnamivorans]|uniref:HD domain-containing protein n=1 Tax=Papillibacter cinnamivorans TaxID=100176 RepID=UPI001FA932A9|nr:HD domain-containing protein [Papillibacter cinnamivorans]